MLYGTKGLKSKRIWNVDEVSAYSLLLLLLSLSLPETHSLYRDVYNLRGMRSRASYEIKDGHYDWLARARALC